MQCAALNCRTRKPFIKMLGCLLLHVDVSACTATHCSPQASWSALHKMRPGPQSAAHASRNPCVLMNSDSQSSAGPTQARAQHQLSSLLQLQLQRCPPSHHASRPVCSNSSRQQAARRLLQQPLALASLQRAAGKARLQQQRQQEGKTPAGCSQPTA